MARINEHIFNLNGVEYRLTYQLKDKPRIFIENLEFMDNKSELLRNYLYALGFDFEQLRGKTTQQLATLTLSHFSTKKEKIVKSQFSPNTFENKKANGFYQKIICEEKLELSETFKVVMICSSRKKDSTLDEFPKVKFTVKGNYKNEFHPDDFIPNSYKSWRKYLEEHQDDINLLMTYKLYSRKEYRCLYERFKNSLYILSAGWGLVGAEFKLPYYDITFSSKSGSSNKRDKITDFKDFNQLDISDNEDVVFIGTPNYVPLFIHLTKNLSNRKIIYWKSKSLKKIKVNDTFEYCYFPNGTNRNWYYELAYAIGCGIIP
jgi:hypothetical protein